MKNIHHSLFAWVLCLLFITSKAEADTTLSTAIQGVSNSSSSFGTYTITSSGSMTGMATGGGRMGFQNTTPGAVTLINSGSISVAGNPSRGIYNTGTFDSITNLGLITADTRGIDSSYASTTPLITLIDNKSTGTISGGSVGIYNYKSNYATIINDGVITSSGGSGIVLDDSQSLIGLLTNNNQISGATDGISNAGTIVTITNNASAHILGNTDGISNAGTIVTITNNASAHILGNTNSIYNAVGSYIGDQNSSSTGLFNSGTIGDSTNTLAGINNAGTISLITNNASGQILGGDQGIANFGGTITTIINGGGLISGGVGNNSVGIFNFGFGSTITNITNNSGGRILGNFSGIYNYSSLIGNPLNPNSGLVNAGTIGDSISSIYGVYNLSGTITTIINNTGGQILGSTNGIYNAGTITTITNDTGGQILAGTNGSGIYNHAASFIGDPTNSNTGLYNSGTIGDATNSLYGIYNNGGTITTITNNAGGQILGNTFGISNSGTITTLNNAQSNLTYSGNLPQNYNIILGSSANAFGKLIVSNRNYWDNGTGTSNFGIYSGPVRSNKYEAVLTGITADFLNPSTLSGSYTSGGQTYSYSLSLASGSSNIWDLLFLDYLSGPSAEDTQASLHALAPKLRSYYTSQIVATNFANMNSYDCNLFDAKGLCVSAGGQKSYVDSPSSNMTSTIVVAGYKVSPTLRIGGFLNQNVSSNSGSNIGISNKSPLMGLFAVWNQNDNKLGSQIKIANAYQDKDVRIARDAYGDTGEAGIGKTNLNTQSYVGELSYAFLANEDKTLVRPYAAVRYTRIKQDAYTEDATVSAPLTYAALEDRSTAALVGIKLNHRLVDKVNLTGSLGVEQDLEHYVDNLTATGVTGLTSENFNDNVKRTRPVASIGAYYMPVKNQRIAADVYYQQLPFQSTGSTTAYVNYMIGF